MNDSTLWFATSLHSSLGFLASVCTSDPSNITSSITPALFVQDCCKDTAVKYICHIWNLGSASQPVKGTHSLHRDLNVILTLPDKVWVDDLSLALEHGSGVVEPMTSTNPVSPETLPAP